MRSREQARYPLSVAVCSLLAPATLLEPVSPFCLHYDASANSPRRRWTAQLDVALPRFRAIAPDMWASRTVALATWPFKQTADVREPEPRPAVELPIIRNIGDHRPACCWRYACGAHNHAPVYDKKVSRPLVSLQPSPRRMHVTAVRAAGAARDHRISRRTGHGVPRWSVRTPFAASFQSDSLERRGISSARTRLPIGLPTLGMVMSVQLPASQTTVALLSAGGREPWSANGYSVGITDIASNVVNGCLA